MATQDISFHDDDDHLWRHDNLARLFLSNYKYFEERIESKVHEAGYPEVRSIHLGVMREMDMDYTRITVLAQRSGVTKQAMSQLVKECERLGFVEIKTDPTDGRAKMVMFSKKGRKFIESSKSIIQSIESDIEKVLGKKRTKELRNSLRIIRDLVVDKDD